jgi:hypothetical protein
LHIVSPPSAMQVSNLSSVSYPHTRRIMLEDDCLMACSAL